MSMIACVCGQASVEGETEDQLVGAMQRHIAEAHADLDLSEARVREYITAALRSGPAKPRIETIGAIDVHELTPERRDDYLAFFDRDAFADNPAWAGCYCMFYYFAGDGEAWQARMGSENRGAIGGLIACGDARGYMAYVDGAPAGWCNAAPRSFFPGLDRSAEFRIDDGERVGSIVCFVIAPQYRRHGIAARLLDSALNGFRRDGLAYAEAYPAREASSDAESYHGPLSLYAGVGFEPYRETERQTIVRKALA